MWERIFKTLAAPGETLHQVAEKNLWKEGLLLVLVIAILKGATQTAAVGNEEALIYLERYFGPSSVDSFSSFMYSPTYMIISSLFSELLGWVVLGAVFFLFAKLFKGHGSMSGMLAGLGYASCPYFLGVPLAALTSLAGNAGSIISGIISFAAAIWVLVLSIIAIRESQQIGTGAAVAVYFIPVVVLGIVFLLLIGFLIAALFLMAP